MVLNHSATTGTLSTSLSLTYSEITNISHFKVALKQHLLIRF